MRKRKIVIPLADKRGIVVLRKEDYTRELNRLVGDTNTYKKIKGDPTKKLKTVLKDIVQKGKEIEIVTKKEARYLVTDVPRLPVIYQLPKIHKNPEHPPGRPISGINSIFSRIGEYVVIIYNRFFKPTPCI